jgi:hypothetical protein
VVRDNQAVDDGYIFQWGIYFNSSLYPDLEGYQNTVTSSFWSPDPSIVSGMNDTLIVIQPNVTGNTYYTYNIIDNFGCQYDTTVALFVIPLPVIFSDTLICGNSYQVANTSAYTGGVWSSNSPYITFSNPATPNPNIQTGAAGIFEVQFKDNSCQDTLKARIEFPPVLGVNINDTTVCLGASATFFAIPATLSTLQEGYSSPAQFTWNTGTEGAALTVNQAGIYSVSYANICFTATDEAQLLNKPCDILVPNVISLSSEVGNQFFFVNSTGVETFRCVIINRWGNLIYEYTDPAASWDGSTMNGNLVTEGTYFYKITGTFEGGQAFEKDGFVVVVY